MEAFKRLILPIEGTEDKRLRYKLINCLYESF